jgi:putative membrane protein
MKVTQIATVIALALACSVLLRQTATAQQYNPGEIKPAPANSPAADPLGQNPQPANQYAPAQSTQGNQILDNPQGRSDTRMGQNNAVRGGEDDQRLNATLAACLLRHNKAEVELGKLAESRATDKDVKQFAQRMVTDHQQVVDKLQRIPNVNEPSGRLADIGRQIDDRALELARQQLESKSGKDFDAAYIGCQIGGHMQMTAALDVLTNQTSGELQKIVNDSRPTVEKHLTQAKSLMEQLNKGGSTENRSQAERPVRQER